MDDTAARVIERIADGLLANRPVYCAALQPGVTDAALDNVERQFSLRLPLGFRALYKWKNGQHPSCSESLQGNRMFTSLESVAETKEMLDGMIGFDFEDERWWRHGWVPFLSNGGGDHLCLDATGEGGRQPGQLVAFWHDWEDRRTEWPSVDPWLQQLAADVGHPR
jgi:cell wall assembly regulator SMI1